MGIVLTKLLLFGKEVEDDLYDWRTDGLRKKQDEVPSFNNLIESCTHPHITTSIITSLVRSITLYDVVKPSTINRKPLEGNVNIQYLIEDRTGERFCELLDQRIEQNESLMKFLVQHGMTKDNQSIYSIALLSSIPPSTLIQQLNSIKGSFIHSLNIENEIQSANQIINHSKTKDPGIRAINNMKQLDKTDERVIQVLVKFAQYYASEQWRENAVIALSQFPSK